MQTDKVTTKLKAKHGLFDNAKGELELFDGIEIDGSNGMMARLSRATIYSKESRSSPSDPVSASTPTGSVQASAMTMNHQGPLGGVPRRGLRAHAAVGAQTAIAHPAGMRASRSTSTPRNSMSTTRKRPRTSEARSSPCRARRCSTRPICSSNTRVRQPMRWAPRRSAAKAGRQAGQPRHVPVGAQRGRDDCGHRSAHNQRTGRFRRRRPTRRCSRATSMSPRTRTC